MGGEGLVMQLQSSRQGVRESVGRIPLQGQQSYTHPLNSLSFTHSPHTGEQAADTRATRADAISLRQAQGRHCGPRKRTQIWAAGTRLQTAGVVGRE